MLFQLPIAQSPFEWFTTHLQLLGWGTVMLVGYKAVRFLSAAQRRVDDDQKKFDEIHSNTTNHIPTALNTLVELAKKQDARWELWMTTKAAQKSE